MSSSRAVARLTRARLPGAGGETLDCGNAGTAMRLLAGALAGRPAERPTLVGDASLSARPMERVAAPLRATGARVETTDGHAPVRIDGRAPAAGARPPTCRSRAPRSSAASTLAGARRRGHAPRSACPGPTRDHTERMLGWLGAPVRRDGPRRRPIDGPAGFRARDITRARRHLVGRGLARRRCAPSARRTIRLEDVGLNPSRLGIIEVLREMGADIVVSPRGRQRPTAPSRSGDIIVRGGTAAARRSRSAATASPTSSTSCR